MIAKQRVNRAAMALTHILVQIAIAQQQSNWKKTRRYWIVKRREAREALYEAWQAAGLEGDPREQPPLGLLWKDNEETSTEP